VGRYNPRRSHHYFSTGHSIGALQVVSTQLWPFQCVAACSLKLSAMRPLPGADALPSSVKPRSRKSSVGHAGVASNVPTAFFIRSEEDSRSLSRLPLAHTQQADPETLHLESRVWPTLLKLPLGSRAPWPTSAQGANAVPSIKRRRAPHEQGRIARIRVRFNYQTPTTRLQHASSGGNSPVMLALPLSRRSTSMHPRHYPRRACRAHRVPFRYSH
jgi:hypothetical protein